MRRLSGDSSTLPTERKRERSPLARPCVEPDGAKTNKAAVQQRQKPARSKTDGKNRRMALSLVFGRCTICPAILGPVRLAVNLSSEEDGVQREERTRKLPYPGDTCRFNAFRKRCSCSHSTGRSLCSCCLSKGENMAPPRGEVLQGTLDLIVLQTLHAMGS